ncbi:hypothetical protein Angca_000957, partial [Angiostrongylus cantonensis]
RAFINYDDLYVTTLAARHGGCVLSGDKFKDILAQPAYSEFHPVILNRTLDVKFHFLPYDVVYHKLDVFYKALPELFIYEDVALRAKMIAQKIFASPDDPEFSKMSTLRTRNLIYIHRRACSAVVMVAFRSVGVRYRFDLARSTVVHPPLRGRKFVPDLSAISLDHPQNIARACDKVLQTALHEVNDTDMSIPFRYYFLITIITIVTSIHACLLIKNTQRCSNDGRISCLKC